MKNTILSRDNNFSTNQIVSVHTSQNKSRGGKTIINNTIITNNNINANAIVNTYSMIHSMPQQISPIKSKASGSPYTQHFDS